MTREERKKLYTKIRIEATHNFGKEFDLCVLFAEWHKCCVEIRFDEYCVIEEKTNGKFGVLVYCEDVLIATSFEEFFKYWKDNDEAI